MGGMNKYDKTGATDENNKFLKALVEEYTSKTRTNLLLPYYKIYRSLDSKKYWILMKYLHADTDKNNTVSEFDIKCSVGCRYQKRLTKTLKDNNFTAIFQSIKFENIEDANKLFQAVKNTVKFLKSQKRFDYSIMVNVELGWSGNASRKGKVKVPKKLRATVKLRGVGKPQKVTFHFMAVGDCLVKWHFLRNAESMLKSRPTKTGSHEPSCKEPTYYANRVCAGLDHYFNKDSKIRSLNGLCSKFEKESPKYTQRISESIARYGKKGGVPAGCAWLRMMNYDRDYKPRRRSKNRPNSLSGLKIAWASVSILGAIFFMLWYTGTLPMFGLGEIYE